MDGGGGVSFLINDTAVLDLYADRMETINLACAQSRTGPLDDKVRPCILCKSRELSCSSFFSRSRCRSFIAHAPIIAAHFPPDELVVLFAGIMRFSSLEYAIHLLSLELLYCHWNVEVLLVNKSVICLVCCNNGHIAALSSAQSHMPQ